MSFLKKTILTLQGISRTVSQVTQHKNLAKVCSSRQLSSRNGLDLEHTKRVQQLAENFTEARELLDDAREARSTVYFAEDMHEAEEAVKKTLKDYEELLGRLEQHQKVEVTRSIGLKMEELKAQLQMIQEEIKT